MIGEVRYREADLVDDLRVVPHIGFFISCRPTRREFGDEQATSGDSARRVSTAGPDASLAALFGRRCRANHLRLAGRFNRYNTPYNRRGSMYHDHRRRWTRGARHCVGGVAGEGGSGGQSLHRGVRPGNERRLLRSVASRRNAMQLPTFLMQSCAISDLGPPQPAPPPRRRGFDELAFDAIAEPPLRLASVLVGLLWVVALAGTGTVGWCIASDIGGTLTHAHRSPRHSSALDEPYVRQATLSTMPSPNR